MSDGNNSTVKQSESYKAFLIIIKSVVKNGNSFAVKYCFDTNKIETVLGYIRQTFFFVPFKIHE